MSDAPSQAPPNTTGVVVYERPPVPRAAGGAAHAPLPPARTGARRLLDRTFPRRGTLVWRIFFAAAAGLGLIVIAVIGAVAVFARQSTDEALERGLADAGRLVAAVLDGRRQALAAGTAVFAQDPKFRSLLQRDSGRLSADVFDRAVEATQRVGATWTQITDADGLRLAKSDDPAARVVSLGETALVGGALARELMSGAGVAGDTAVFEGVAVPVTAGADGQLVGVLMAARTLDSTAARELAAETRSEVLIYLRDADGRPRAAASTLEASARAAVLDALRGRIAGGDSAAALRVHIDGAELVGQETVLRAATSGVAVGGVLTLRSRDEALAPYVALQRRIALAGAGGLLLAFAGAFGVARRITEPIRALRDATRRAVEGNLQRSDVRIESEGEVAELADAVRSVIDQVYERHELAALVERARALPTRSVHDAPTLPASSLAPGTTLAGRYTIDAVLGVGGNGIVYRATDDELSEVVAVKTLRPEALAGGAEALDRLKEEIRLARRITHTGVVRIHDFGEAEGTYFITMEHVAGLSLAEVLRRVGRLSPPAVIALGKQLCGALAAAHAQGVIHRDVKPQNLVVQPDGALKVLDFGVARLAERTSGLTATGLLVGTPAYMAPEQLLDEPVDVRADVYAAGVVLYEAATGRPPHQASTAAALIARVLSDSPIPPASIEPEVAPPVSDAIMRALARDRDDRPSSAAALHDLLDRARRAQG